MEHKDQVAAFYAKTAASYEAASNRHERANELGELRERVAFLARGQRILELACGTGYWTGVMAASAERIVATDSSVEMLELARKRGLDADKVTFRQADGLDLPQDLGEFTAVFIGFWWSHLKRDEQEAFLTQLRARVGKDVLLIVLDDAYVDGSSSVIARTDAQGNTYQIVSMPDGARVELPKSYPTDSTLRKRLADCTREIKIVRLEHYWLLTCRLK
jgi:protein-L-isoaspartate O-methyltransferase